MCNAYLMPHLETGGHASPQGPETGGQVSPGVRRRPSDWFDHTPVLRRVPQTFPDL